MNPKKLDTLRAAKGTQLEDWLLLLELANEASSGAEAAEVVRSLCEAMDAHSWPLLIEVSFHSDRALLTALSCLEKKCKTAKGDLGFELGTLESIIYAT